MFPWEDLRTPDECRQAAGWLIRDHLSDNDVMVTILGIIVLHFIRYSPWQDIAY